MKVIGLTGRSGAGKGYVCDIFASFGISSLDTDKLSRIVSMPGTPCLEELRSYFGHEIINVDGTLNRAALAEIVFADGHEHELNVLNGITHRYILEYCRKWIGDQREIGAEAVVIDAPQLYESGFDAECDFVVAVLANEEKRIERIICRDGISRERAVGRLSAQHSDDFFLSHADYVIRNDGENLNEQIMNILIREKILKNDISETLEK